MAIKTAEVVGFTAAFQPRAGGPRIKDPLNKTLHMEIRKARARREKALGQQPADTRFNPIRGLDKLRG